MKQHRLRLHNRMTLLLFTIFTTCSLLFSACNTTPSNTKTNTSHKSSTTGISDSLKNQGDMKLETFQQWITLMKQNGGDTTVYQQQYNTDQQALHTAQNPTAYQSALKTLNGHVDAIQMPAMKVESQNLQQQLQQQVTSWGQQHQYHNNFDNTNYPLGYEYGSQGIGGWVQDDLNQAKTMADYQQEVENLQMYLTNFQAMKTNSSDRTPYNQVHQTDMQLIQHYQKTDKKVVVVSLEEQAMRLYDHGKLVKAFLVTTGRPNLPTPPGVWWVEGKKSPTVFKASVPKGNPEWYPDTPINYAMQYHSNGYFIHDSWWRNDYGPGTNFPHQDASGDPFSAQGSHGCVNLAKDDAASVYNFVELFTSVIIY